VLDITKSVSCGVAVLVHGNGTSQGVRFHLQSVSPPANKIVQHTRLHQVCFLVLCLLSCFSYSSTTVCSPASSIKQYNLIVSQILIHCLHRCNLHKVISGLHRLPKIFNPKAPQSPNLIDIADLIPNKWGLISPHKPGNLFLHLYTSAND